MPHVGWANAVPDANAVVDVTIGDERLAFTGYGYHDKNWGDVPFVDVVQSWYWGHGRFGPYSVVWFDTKGDDGINYVSSYVSKNGEILAASCQAGSVQVRPYGGNSTYPPQETLTNPDGFDMSFDLGHLGVLKAKASIEVETVSGFSFYARYIGSIGGGIEGGKQYEGKAQFEQFRFNI